MYSGKIIKKTSCGSCGFFDGHFCRMGLGWVRPETLEDPHHCKNIARIREERCGTCVWFEMKGNERLNGHCTRGGGHDGFRNFYNLCGHYRKEEGKDIRPHPDIPPAGVV